MAKKNSNKNKSKNTIILVSILSVIVISIIAIFVAIALSQPKEKKFTADDLMREAEQNRIDAIVEQVKLKAEIHKEEHGYYPYSLKDFIQDPSYLDEYNAVYVRLDDGNGFTITYSSPSGQKTLYSD